MKEKSMEKTMLKSFTVRMTASICLVFGFLVAVPGTVNAKYLSYNGIKGLLGNVDLKSIPIWHLQLEITVADKDKSGTDDNVYFYY